MIIKNVMLHSAEDLRQFMYQAMQSSEDIGVHTADGKIADAKSILGLMALDYTKPVKVVTEDSTFIKHISQWNNQTNSGASEFRRPIHISDTFST